VAKKCNKKGNTRAELLLFEKLNNLEEKTSGRHTKEREIESLV